MAYLIQDSTLTNIANAIRTKTQRTGSLTPAEMVTEINSIVTDPSSSTTAAASDLLESKTAYSQNNLITGTIPIKTTTDITVSGARVVIPTGYYNSTIEKNIDSGVLNSPINSVNISEHQAIIIPSVTLTPGYISDTTKTGSATTIQVTDLIDESITITPSLSQQTIDVTNYISAEVAAVPSGTLGTIEANKSITDHTATVTPVMTAGTAGYNEHSATSGTAITITASELVSDTLSETANGTYDCTNYQYVTVAVPEYTDLS